MKKLIAALLSIALIQSAQAMEGPRKLNEPEQEKLNKKLADAIRCDNLEKVKKYLERGANPNTKTNPQDTSYFKLDAPNKFLIYTLTYGDDQIICELIKHGANPNVCKKKIADYCCFFRTYETEPALIMAAKKGRLEVCNKLIEHGADVDAQCKKTGMTALMVAA